MSMPNGFIDVQAPTCAQLAGTYQEDADALSTWYSGWYNGLSRSTISTSARVRSSRHEVIM